MRCRTSHAGGCGRGNVHPAAVLAARRGGGVPPRAAVLDGITSHITHDGLASVAYTEVGDTHQIMILKSPDTAKSIYWVWTGDDAAIRPFHIVLNQDITTGNARAQISDPTSTISTTANDATTYHDGNAWHMLHGMDWDVSGTGTPRHKVDGTASRGTGDTYPRFAVDANFPKYHTVGIIRRSVGPVLSNHAPCTVGYYALITGEQLTDVQMDAIYAAWDTGGGRDNTRLVSGAISAQLTTGTLRWAGDLDGSVPHANPDSVAAPIHVDTVIVDADY